MPRDAFTLLHLAKELDSRLTGGKISRIQMPSPNDVYFYIYTPNGNFKLLICVHPENYRVHLTKSGAENPKVPFNYCMLLRKHLSNARIDGISLAGFDRVMKIDFTNASEFTSRKYVMYSELMGRYSNIFLTADGVILGSAKTAAHTLDGARLTLAGMPYPAMPEREGLLPGQEREITELFASCGATANTVLKNIPGFSAFSAHQAERFMQEKTDAYAAFYEFVYAPPLPCVILGTDGKPKEFSVRREKDFDIISFDTVSDAMDYFYAQTAHFNATEKLRRGICASIEKHSEKSRKKLAKLLEKRLQASDAEKDRQYGELIISNLYRLKQSSRAEVENYFSESNEKTVILLDEHKSPAQNAQLYFKKYAKKKNALTVLDGFILQTGDEIKYLESLAAQISALQDLSGLEAFAEEVDLLNNEKKPVKGSKDMPRTGFRHFVIDDFNVRCGRNNMDNDRLLKLSRPDDIWLHAKDLHGTHTVIETLKRKVPENVLTAAAEICAFYSGAQKSGKTPVDYCYIKFVKKPRGAKPGFVIYTDHKTRVVKPCAHSEFFVK